MRAAHERAVACLDRRAAAPDPPGPADRDPVRGHAGWSASCGARRGDGPHPVVVLLSGLDSTKEELRSTEETFLDRGLATFSVDGPGQGEAEYDLPIRGDWRRRAEAIMDALGDLPEVDAAGSRVWGVSLGGYYAPRVAAALGDRVTRLRRAGRARTTSATAGRSCRSSPARPSGSGPARRRRRGRAGSRTPCRWRASPRRSVAPLLIVFGRQDRLIPWQHAERLRDAAADRPSC